MRRVLSAGLLALLVVAAAACSKADDGKGVASAGGSATPGATPSLSELEQGIKHAQCMRAHGVPEVDPQVGSDGNVRVGGGYDKGAVDGDVLRQAIEACKQYEPVLPADVLAQKLEAAREESRCMRAHGVENFPDPGPDLRVDIPDSVRQDPQYDEAKAVCIRRGGRSASPTP